MIKGIERERILEIWNKFYKFDPTSLFQLERKYFQNPHVVPIGEQVNEGAFSLLCKRRGEPREENSGKEAWVICAGFTDRIEFIKLLKKQIEYARDMGIERIYYSNFSPGYFFPGIDKEKYPELYDLLTELGFSLDSEALAMEADIGEIHYTQKEKNEAEIRNLKIEETEELLKMVRSNFPYDCYLRVEGVIKHGSLDQISIAKLDNRIVGYSMYASGEGPFEFSPGERFGCFEVLEAYRSMGIGGRLLTSTLINMKANGIRHAYFLWTSEKASHLYSRYGFRITRKFQIMSLSLLNHENYEK